MSFELSMMLGALVLLALIGFPIGFSLLLSGTLYFLLKGQDPTFAAEIVLHGLFSNFVLLAVPLFIFAANVMNSGTITDRILKASLAMVGHLRGGLAHVNIVSSLFFAGMSGAATADVAGVGSILMKMMRDRGRYSDGFAAALTGASATIGPIFPPSIMMVFYALVTSTSIGDLFLAGILPGVFMAVVLMVTVGIVARRRDFPVEPAMDDAEKKMAIRKAILPLMMPVVLLAGIYSGVFSPTEAAAVAAFYAIILSVVVYRALSLKKLFIVCMDTARTTSIVATLIFGAFVFSYVLTAEQIPNRIAGLIQQWDLNRIEFLLVVNLLLLALGTVLASATIVLVIVPILMPAAIALGVDPVHFGIIVVLNVTIGLVTPPYGVVLFVISGLTKISIGEIVRESWLFIAVLVSALLFLTFVPSLALFLPSLLGN